MGEYVTLKGMPISFPVLSVPKPSPQRKDPKFSCAIAFMRDNPAHMQELQRFQNTIEKVRAENKASMTPKIGPSKNNANIILANATANPDYPPTLRDITNNEIDRMIAGQEFYPGAICNYVVDVYFSPSYSRVCLSILGVQKVADGPRLDNRPDGSNLFEAEAPPAYGQPQQQYAPPAAGGYAPQTPTPAQPQQQYGQPFPNATTPHDPLG